MKRVTLADDDPSIQDAVKIILERAGYEVTVLPNGDSLLEDGVEAPGIFILDKQLSGVDGLEVCRFLKNNPATREVPVLMLSASPQISRLAILAGADDFLEKPFNMQELRDMVARYCKNG